MKKSPFYYIGCVFLALIVCVCIYFSVKGMIAVWKADIPTWAKWYMLTR